jgi:hypothetical protein
MGAPDYWSQFWIWFPLGTHSVVSREPQVVTTETLTFVTYEAEGISRQQYRTINSVVARFKPGHWVCRGVKFEWEPSLISSVASFDEEPTIASGEVSDWAQYTQATNRPAWDGTQATGDGVNDRLTTTDATLLAAMGGDVTLVFHGARIGSGVLQAMIGFRDAVGPVLYVGWDSSNRFFCTRDGATVNASGASDTADHVYAVTVSGTTCTLYVDNVQVATGTVGGSALTLTTGKLFADGNNANYANASLRGFALFGAVVSDTHRAQLTDWFTDPGDFDQYPGWEITPV